MRRPAHADKISKRPRGLARGVMRAAKNTPTDALTVAETMRLLLVLLAAALAAPGAPARAACSPPADCTGPDVVATASARAGAQLAQPGEVVTALAPGDPATAAARVSLSDAAPAGGLAMRPDAVRAAAAEQRAEPRSPAGSEPSSAWLMLFAGLAFAGFVVAKRSRG
jgi:hypothetical protein